LGLLKSDSYGISNIRHLKVLHLSKKTSFLVAEQTLTEAKTSVQTFKPPLYSYAGTSRLGLHRFPYLLRHRCFLWLLDLPQEEKSPD
jgi:hypothetical protein